MGLPAGRAQGDNSQMMSDSFLTLLFWSCAGAVVLAQLMILRSTWRAWKLGGARSARTAVAEWSFAVVPALAIFAVLWLSWGALV